MQLSPKEFEYQFRCLYRPLNMYALRYTENLDDAEDIVQQAFSDVWEKLVGGTSIQNLKAYMYQTVRNRSLTLITNRQTHCETTELTDLEDLTEEERIIRSERDDGKEAGEFCPILYKKERVELLYHGQFWYSETPYKPSKSWNSFCNRICT